MKQIIDYPPAPAAPYSRAVRAGGCIYISGTIADVTDPAATPEGDVAGQTRAVIERMRDVLAAAGSSLADVVAVTVYLKSAADFAAMNDAYRPFWPADPPTRTTVIAGFVRPHALVEITMVAVPANQERTVVHPAGWAKSPNPYSYAIRSGDMLFMAGLVARSGTDNAAIPGNVGQQTRTIMDRAGELLDAAGMSLEHVVSSRVYLTDASSFAAMNEAYAASFRSAPPARATVQSGLPGDTARVEITFTASSAPRQAIGAPPGGLPLSPAIRAGNRLFLSGMLGNTPEKAGDPAAQTHETLARLAGTLEAAGATPANVVESLVYITDARYFEPMNDQYRAFFGTGFPARTTVVTPLVAKDGLVEIMMTAVL
jgi:aminoacrylate peracid reductase